MLENYLKIALKVLARRKFFTFISLFAIAFTLTVLLIASAFIDNALSPSPPESRLDRMLHVSVMEMRGERLRYRGAPGYAFLDRYARDLPGVEAMSIHSAPSMAASFVSGEKIVSRMIRTDGAYWRIFDHRFIEGAPFTEDDNRAHDPVAVISKATRQRFFGGEPAVGRFIECDGERFRVVGVVEDVPIHRVHAAAHIWTPITTIKSPELLEQLMGGFNAVMLARDRSDLPRIKAAFRQRLTRVEYPDPTRWNTMAGIPMTRLEEYAAEGAGITESGEPRAGQFLASLAVAALGFLLLPTINLVSINVSRILERASEIGVRKAFGASSTHLTGQFLLESAVLCVIGTALALPAAAGALALVNQSGLIPSAHFTPSYRVLLYGLGLALLLAVLSGAYPAWRMSRLHPVAALRGGER